MSAPYPTALVAYWLDAACEAELAGDHHQARLMLRQALDVERNWRTAGGAA